MNTRLMIGSFALTFILSLAANDATAHERGYERHRAPPVHHGYGHAPPRHGRHHYGRPKHHRHHHHGHATLAGAVLLGTLVATLDRPRPAGVIVHRPGYGVRQPYGVNRNVWYQRDVNGDCFEVQLQHGGTQLWTLTRPSQCY